MQSVEVKKYEVSIKWRRIIKLLIPILFVFAIIKAYSLRWVCDDSFISFRYAKNLLNGFGLVFNQNEFVEGYTNFLWTILIYIGMLFQLDPIHTSIVLGLFFYILTLSLLLKTSSVLYNSKFFKNSYFLPFSFFSLSLQTHSQIYATGGLETSMFSFLLLTGSVFILLHDIDLHIFIGNFFLTLACLTRPDALLFYGIINLYILFSKIQFGKYSNSLLRILFIQFPFLVLYIPYFLWKFNYYGYIFPNTFYAKSGAGTNWSQGFEYLSLYFKTYYSFFLLPILLLLKLIGYPRIYSFYLSFIKPNYLRRKKILNQLKTLKARNKIIKSNFSNYTISLDSFYILFLPSLLYIIYLYKIGGDFMFARLLIPLSPILFLYLEILLFQFRINWLRVIFILFFLFGLIFYKNPFEGTKIPIINHISNENDIYKIKKIYELKLNLIPVSRIFKEEEISIAFGGSQAMFAFYLEAPLAIETTTGLTDEYIAHLDIFERGKIGHEKKAPLEYLYKRNILIHLFPDNEIPIRDYNLFKIKPLEAEFRILQYDAATFENLKKTHNFEFVNFEKYLDKYIQNINEIPTSKLNSDYKEFKTYYFNMNQDFQREKIFIHELKKR